MRKRRCIAVNLITSTYSLSLYKEHGITDGCIHIYVCMAFFLYYDLGFFVLRHNLPTLHLVLYRQCKVLCATANMLVFIERNNKNTKKKYLLSIMNLFTSNYCACLFVGIFWKMFLKIRFNEINKIKLF